MYNKNKDKERIWEVIVVNGIRYVKDAINTRLIASQVAHKGSNVNVISFNTLVKTGSGLYR